MLFRESNPKHKGASEEKSMLGRIKILVDGNSSAFAIRLIGYVFITKMFFAIGNNRKSGINFSIWDNRISKCII